MRIGIIGAGICGLYLAWQLSQKGEEVIVFEKKEKIGKEICSGLFSERILEFIPESKKLIEKEVEYCLIHFPQKTVTLKFNRKFFLMNHAQLDEMVAHYAEKAGAKVILNKNIKKSDLLIPEKIIASYGYFNKIIGCDGADSLVRKVLNLPQPTYRLALQGFTEEKNYSANLVETWPIKNGFIWRIPRTQKVEYGAIGLPNSVNKLFNDFLNKKNIKLDNVKGAIVAQGLVLPKKFSDITLCGEAMGLTKPWSGGGVIWGLIACNLLLQNFPDFVQYRKALKRFFLSKIILGKTAIKIVDLIKSKYSFLLPKKIKIESDFLL